MLETSNLTENKLFSEAMSYIVYSGKLSIKKWLDSCDQVDANTGNMFILEHNDP